MQIGKLKSENDQLLESYKSYGFNNKTKMLDHALDLLRMQLKKETRRNEREKMLAQYVSAASENYFAGVDGDDFE